MKFCTTMEDEVFLKARDAYECEYGRWKRGSLKDLLEKSMELFTKKYALKKRR